MTKIIHATPYTGVKQGGPSSVTPPLAEQLISKGMEISVVGQIWPDDELVPWPDGVQTTIVQTTDTSGFGYSAQLPGVLRRAVVESDIVHSHGLWMYLSHLADKFSSSLAKPHVITVHGMLEAYILARSPAKKKLARRVFQDRALHRASCIHALCTQEADDVRALGFRGPIAVIPNGIKLDDFADSASDKSFADYYPQFADKKILLFLGRIHPKKGLLHLVKAWSNVIAQYPDWHLVIAGPDEIGHQSEVEQLVTAQNVAATVTFIGTISGQRKRGVLRGADAFVLSSFSEGFSIAILEALAYKLPVVITPECHFPEAARAGAAIEVRPNVDSTTEGLKLLLEMTDAERTRMGLQGYELVKSEYSWDRIADEMIEVYTWCLEGGNPPGSVRID